MVTINILTVSGRCDVYPLFPSINYQACIIANLANQDDVKKLIKN